LTKENNGFNLQEVNFYNFLKYFSLLEAHTLQAKPQKKQIPQLAADLSLLFVALSWELHLLS
jgi:hypothetical protein